MDILIIGSSGHAKVVIDIVRAEGKHRVLGLLDDQRAPGEETLGVPVLGAVEKIHEIMQRTGATHGLIAVGDNGGRMKVSAKIADRVPGFTYVTAVHPSAVIGSQVMIAPGTVVMPGAIINAGTTVGNHCIINTNASVDHDCSLGGFVSIAPGAALGGHCQIGSGTAVGLNAGIVQGITVGTHCVIGAGALVLESVPDLHVAIGVPAKCVRTRLVGEPYL